MISRYSLGLIFSNYIVWQTQLFNCKFSQVFEAYIQTLFSDHPTDLLEISSSLELLKKFNVYRYETSLYGHLQLILCQAIALAGMLIDMIIYYAVTIS